MPSPRLCFASRLTGVAGPASFQRRLADGLARRGFSCAFDLNDVPYDAVLVIGATRHLPGLVRARRRGVPILQRLDGRNWIHRRRRTGVRHFLRAEWNNRRLRWVRDRLATTVVYQSEFARSWWERDCGRATAPASVVLNGVDLDQYSPRGQEAPARDLQRIQMVEARFEGGYEIGLDWALGLAGRVAKLGGPVELSIVGAAPPSARLLGQPPSGVTLRWHGVVPPDSVPAHDRSAHVLFSSDLLPACPNSVIEALACGLPVLAFDTGALPEIVKNDAGRLAAYGGDPWRLDPPDLDGLAAVAGEVLADLSRFRAAARARAEEAFSLDRMVQGYLDALGW